MPGNKALSVNNPDATPVALTDTPQPEPLNPEPIDEGPKTRRLKPTRIVAGSPVDMPKLVDTTPEPSKQNNQPLSPQEKWELKNQAKLLEQAQEKLNKIKQELEALPTDEQKERENLEYEQAKDQRILDNAMQDFQEKLQQLKKQEEKRLNEEASEKAALQILELEKQLAAEKEKSLSESEIAKITKKYVEALDDRYDEWKKEHISSTKADFIDFELGLAEKELGTPDFAQAIEKNLGPDFKKYNQATQDLILMKLQQGFFNLAGQQRKWISEWESHVKREMQNKAMQGVRSFVRERTKDLLKNDYDINPLNNDEYSKIVDFIVPRDSLQIPAAYSDDQIKEKIQDFLNKKDQVDVHSLEQIAEGAIDVPEERNVSEYPLVHPNKLSTVYPSSRIEIQDVQILDPEEIVALPESENVTEVEFLEPQSDQIASKQPVLQISAGNKAKTFNNKFLQSGAKKQSMLTPGFQDPRFMISKSQQNVIPQSPKSNVSERLKTRRLTDEEMITRDMQDLKFRQAEEFNAIPYEYRSESDPFGQQYLYKNPINLEEIIGVAEEIEEYLQNLPILQKAQLKVSKGLNYLKEQRKNAPEEYQPLESSEGNNQPYKESMTDEQIAEQAMEELVDRGYKPTVQDVTKTIVPELESHPETLSEAALRIGSEVAALGASGRGSLIVPA